MASFSQSGEGTHARSSSLTFPETFHELQKRERKMSTAEKISALLRRKSSPATPDMMSSLAKAETDVLRDKAKITPSTTPGGRKYHGRGNLYRRFCIKRRKFKMKRRRPKRRHSAPGNITPGGASGAANATSANVSLSPGLSVEDDCDACHKVLLLGDSGVGKTALIRSLRGQPVLTTSTPTIGFDHVSHTVTVDGLRIRLEIWDLPGQSRFRSMRRSYYSNVKGVILVYDVTNVESFAWLGNNWLRTIDKDIEADSDDPVPVYIVANKCDEDAARMVSRQQGQEVSHKHMCLGFYETSARTGHDVEWAFREIAYSLTDTHKPKLTNPVMRASFRRKKVIEVLDRETGEGEKLAEERGAEAGKQEPIPSSPPPRRSRDRWKALCCTCAGR